MRRLDSLPPEIPLGSRDKPPSGEEHSCSTFAEPLRSRLDEGILRAVDWLVRDQHSEGFWVGMLQSNSCMEAEWVLAMHYLGIDDDPKYDGIIRAILGEQRADGSWGVFYKAPNGDINTTVECYAALRASGLAPESAPLSSAREWILANGGLANIRNFTKYWLALIGEWPWEGTPTIPPELIFFPPRMPLNIYHFASWARSTIVPLSILSARRPARPLPEDRRLDELFPQGRSAFDFRLPRKDGWLSWEGFFHVCDRILRLYARTRRAPFRETAIRACLEWIIRRQETDGAWSGIQPPWIYALLALHTEGYGLDHPILRAGLRAFDSHWSYERDGGIHLQASESPVWDTVLSLRALADCGEERKASVSIASALEWLLNKQIGVPGDWAVRVPGVPCGGWAFQRANSFYPDVDDTAVTIEVLARLRPFTANQSAVDRAIRSARDWVLAMQCSNGGWAAFDRDNDFRPVTKIPFCDFGELLDPPSVDVTAHVIEALAALGWDMTSREIEAAVRFIRREQEAEGSWFGRWGVNHIYGTATVLPALRAIGEDMSSAYVLRAADWLASRQNADGGWGETPASYMDDSLRGVGESTASQTAWAIMGLVAVDSGAHDDAVRRGIDFLLFTQHGGTWEEPQYTGTGFPGYSVGERIRLRDMGASLKQGTELQRAFMINYNLYRHYFPLMALGRARYHLQLRRSARDGGNGETTPNGSAL